jgi:hypothetical protein
MRNSQKESRNRHQHAFARTADEGNCAAWVGKLKLNATLAFFQELPFTVLMRGKQPQVFALAFYRLRSGALTQGQTYSAS